MLHGICGLLTEWGFGRDALAALCAFDLVLRTGEALELRGGDIEATEKGVGIVLKLRQTKFGCRRGADEFVVVDDSRVQAAFKLLSQDCAAGDLLIGCLPHHWRYRCMPLSESSDCSTWTSGPILCAAAERRVSSAGLALSKNARGEADGATRVMRAGTSRRQQPCQHLCASVMPSETPFGLKPSASSTG